MAKAVRLEGLEDALAKLAKEVEGVEGRTSAGIADAGSLVLAQAQDNAPVDTGMLRASGEFRMIAPMTAAISFSAEYALPVHEDMQAAFRSGGPKYLERALGEKTAEVVEAIRSHAEIK